MIHELRDLLGNRDGIWQNEHTDSGTLGRRQRASVSSQALRSALSTGLSTEDERTTLTEFLRAGERRWTVPVTELDPIGSVGSMHFAVTKALMLIRLDRHPSTIRDTHVWAAGSVDDTPLAARDIRVRCYAPTGPATGHCVVLVPGHALPATASIDTIQALNASGHGVVALEHDWTPSAAPEDHLGLRLVRDVAAVLATAQAQYGSDRVHALGCSVGASVGVLGALLLAMQGRIQLQGPPLHPAVPAVLVSPWVGSDTDLVALGQSGTPRPGLPKQPAALRRPGLHATVAEAPQLLTRATQQVLLADLRVPVDLLSALTPTRMHILSHIAEGLRPIAPIHILQATRDPFHEPALVRGLAHALDASLHWVPERNHLLELSAATPPMVSRWLDPGAPAPEPTPTTEPDPTIHGAARDRSLRFALLAARSTQGATILPENAHDHIYLIVPGLFTERYPFYLREPCTRMSALGLEHAVVPVDTDQTVSRNAEQIRQTVLQHALDGRKVVLVGHSKGGIDIAEALSVHAELRSCVEAVIAVQVPWLGSPVADFVAGRSVWAQGHRLVVERAFAGDEQALLDLQEPIRKAHIKTHPWPEAVPTVCLATALKQRASLLSVPDSLLSKTHGPTDGFVPVASAVLPGSDAVFIRDVDHGGVVLPAPFGLSAHFPSGDILIALIALALERAAQRAAPS